VRLECAGDRLRSWVNGVAIVDYRDPVDLSGIVALQVHSGKDAKIRWRNVRIRDLGIRKWEPLFNGKDLEGWKPVGDAEWTIQQGALAGRLKKRGYGALATPAAMAEFTMRLVFLPVEGKAGVSFGAAAPDGETGSRVGLVGGRPQEWNEFVLSVHGGRAAVHLNGDRVADVRVAAGDGPAAIEMVGEGSRILLKSVELLGPPRRE
jgi:hypothetical protein